MNVVRYLAITTMTLALSAVPATAGPILLGTSENAGGFLSMQQSQWGAQTFTLTQTIDISAIELGFVHSNAFTSRVQLVQGTPGSGTTLFDTTFSDVANANLNFLYEKYSLAASLTLGPGTYYLVATNSNSPTFGWSFGDPLASPSGSIGTWYACLDANSPTGCDSSDPKASTEWYPDPLPTDENLDFRLLGAETTPVPEPSTLLFVGGGWLAATTANRFRRRRTTSLGAELGPGTGLTS